MPYLDVNCLPQEIFDCIVVEWVACLKSVVKLDVALWNHAARKMYIDTMRERHPCFCLDILKSKSYRSKDILKWVRKRDVHFNELKLNIKQIGMLLKIVTTANHGFYLTKLKLDGDYYDTVINPCSSTYFDILANPRAIPCLQELDWNQPSSISSSFYRSFFQAQGKCLRSLKLGNMIFLENLSHATVSHPCSQLSTLSLHIMYNCNYCTGIDLFMNRFSISFPVLQNFTIINLLNFNDIHLKLLLQSSSLHLKSFAYKMMNKRGWSEKFHLKLKEFPAEVCRLEELTIVGMPSLSLTRLQRIITACPTLQRVYIIACEQIPSLRSVGLEEEFDVDSEYVKAARKKRQRKREEQEEVLWKYVPAHMKLIIEDEY